MLLKPPSVKMPVWVVPVLVALLFATAIGCASEPDVVVVEKEVVKEVVVTATPATAPGSTRTPIATPTPQSQVAATPPPTASMPIASPVPQNKVVMMAFSNDNYQFTQVSAQAFSEGISLRPVESLTSSGVIGITGKLTEGLRVCLKSGHIIPIHRSGG